MDNITFVFIYVEVDIYLYFFIYEAGHDIYIFIISIHLVYRYYCRSVLEYRFI